MGYGALQVNTTGSGNTATGAFALDSNTSGFNNTATGISALAANSKGEGNAAFGSFSLSSNTTGNENSAFGDSALSNNITGLWNTAVGFSTLGSNKIGESNTAVGFQSLVSNSASYNTAVGGQSLLSNTTGSNNVAIGYQALYSSKLGNDNDALGYQSLTANTSGSGNTAIGHNSMLKNTTGAENIALGIAAGSNLTTGNLNIDVGNAGDTADTGKIRIGTTGSQTQTFIAGIENAKITGSAVYVTSSGQLGVLASSERYKTSIASIETQGEKLAELRPVSFHLKSEPDGVIQYGLIAEEVARVYPELVIRDQKGDIQGVRYEELVPLLLSALVQQQALFKVQADHAAAQDAKLSELDDLKRRMLELERLNDEMRDNWQEK